MGMELSNVYIYRNITIALLAILIFFCKTSSAHSAFLPDEIVMHDDFIDINLDNEGVPYFIADKSEYIIRYSDSVYFVKDKKPIFLGKIQFTDDYYVSDYKNVYVADINYDGKYEFLITADVTNGMIDHIFYIVDSNGKNIGNNIVSKLVKKEFCSNYDENFVYFANPQFNKKHKAIFMSSKDGHASYHYLLNFEGNTYKLRQKEMPYRYGDIVINKLLKYKEENLHSTDVVYYGYDAHVVGHINDAIYIFSDTENKDKRKKIYHCDFSAIDILENKNGEIWLKIKTKIETGWVKQSDQVVLFDPDGNTYGNK